MTESAYDNVVGGNQGGGEFGGRAGVLQGTVGAADGIYVLNSNNILAGVSIAADGSAVSTFGDLGEGANFSGNVTQLSHPASNNGAAGSFAPVGEEPANASLSVSIMDGMSIEGRTSPWCLSPGALLTIRQRAIPASPICSLTAPTDWHSVRSATQDKATDLQPSPVCSRVDLAA